MNKTSNRSLQNTNIYVIFLSSLIFFYEDL
jgi:hypothetical protein